MTRSRYALLQATRPWLVCLLALGLLMAPLEAAHGENAPDKSAQKRARDLFYEGVKLLDSGRYREACTKLEDSLLAFPGTGTRGKLAECYEKRGMLASAYELYREVERLARDVGDERAKVARERANMLEPKVPRLVIEPGTSASLPGFVVALDGKPLKRSSLGIALFVDPGRHEIIASAPGREPWRTTFQAMLGKSRSVQLPDLQPAKPETPGSKPGASSMTRKAGWALVGAGTIAAAIGLGFGAYALVNSDDFDTANTPATISTYTIAAGIVMATTGGALLLLDRRSRTRPRESAVITPVVTDEWAGIQVLRRF